MQDRQMKTGQAWLGAIAVAMTMSWSAGAVLAQSTDPGEDLDASGVPDVPADAQISRNQDGQQDPNRGPVTNLPLPRYVSLKGSEGNARRGPSLSHRIDWVFRHAGMPLRVTAEFGHWRRVEDQDGAGGWVHYSLLSGVRTAIVQKDMLDLMAKPEARANVVARAEAGAIVRLHECNIDWCRVSGGGEKGWVPKTTIWGADAAEIRD
jgi:SH3-like domain-containing protein